MLFNDVNIFIGFLHEQAHSCYLFYHLGVVLEGTKFTLVCLKLLLVSFYLSAKGIILLADVVAAPQTVGVEYANDERKQEEGPNVFEPPNPCADL